MTVASIPFRFGVKKVFHTELDLNTHSQRNFDSEVEAKNYFNTLDLRGFASVSLIDRQLNIEIKYSRDVIKKNVLPNTKNDECWIARDCVDVLIDNKEVGDIIPTYDENDNLYAYTAFVYCGQKSLNRDFLCADYPMSVPFVLSTLLQALAIEWVVVQYSNLLLGGE